MTECEKENFHRIGKMGETWYRNGNEAAIRSATSVMYDALEQIANMEPGEAYDEMCDIYTDCDTCHEMIDIAKEALNKVRGEE